jgi:hypothetical protein
MSSETVQQAGADPRAAPLQLAGIRRPAPLLAALRADAERMVALRDVGRALLGSRLLVWAAAAATIALFGFGPTRGAFDPSITRGSGWLGRVLAAPAARWDSAWYLVIAHFGYRPDLGSFTEPRDAFFPLYPLGLRGIAWLGVPAILAGVLLSTAALAGALYGIHRLTTLELDRRPDAGTRDSARLAVLLTAFAPMAFFLSAVYSESLYLALSVAVFWSARQGRWALAGVLGALAGATRSTGLVLLLPALVIYLYGPREDRSPDFERQGRARLLGRYRLRPDVLWLGLMPAGVALFGLWLALDGGSVLAPFHAQEVWGRELAGPFVGVWDGIRAAFEGVRQLLSFQTRHIYYPSASGSPTVAASHNVSLLAFLLMAIPMLVWTARRLPGAYLAYVVAALALPLSYPVPAQPLMSLPRFLLVLFPLTIASAMWLSSHPRAQRPLIALSALLMVVFVAQFATWHWVA